MRIPLTMAATVAGANCIIFSRASLHDSRKQVVVYTLADLLQVNLGPDPPALFSGLVRLADNLPHQQLQVCH